MADLEFKGVGKVYNGGIKAVSDLTMNINDKDFVVIVGPSGCGKTTILRMIAGLEDITFGDLLVDGEKINKIPTKNRDVAMVFQNYALFPHMTVFENIAIGLNIKKTPKMVVEQTVNQVAKLLKIDDCLDRYPSGLSGGQKQRVALGRAIVKKPKLFLFDEPLSNLDAKLRTQMRAELIDLHKRLDATFVYVTHDQVEAMTMGTKIVVMNEGVMQQLDTPQNLYSHPKNKFVAGFIGMPQMNFFNVEMRVENNSVEFIFCEKSILKGEKILLKNVEDKYFDGRKVILGIRPQNVRLKERSVNENLQAILRCQVKLVEHLGSECNVFACLCGDFGYNVQNCADICFCSDSNINVKQGDEIEIELDLNGIHLFDMETEESIL